VRANAAVAAATSDSLLIRAGKKEGFVVGAATGRTIALVAGALLLVAITACSDGDEPDTSDNIVSEGNVAVGTVRVGDCFDDPPGVFDVGGVTIGSLDAVPCAKAHDNEVFASFQYPADKDAPFPGDDAVRDFAAGTCLPSFGPYVGRDYETSILDITWVAPVSRSWRNHREVLCILYHVDLQRLRGTMRDSGR
jgi:hypothetical protein